MTLRHVTFLTGMHRLAKANVSPQTFIVLYAVRSYPGSSFSDIGGKVGPKFQSSVYKACRLLIERGFIEDQRPLNYAEKTPGVLYITPAGEKFMREVFGDNETDGTLSPGGSR